MGFNFSEVLIIDDDQAIMLLESNLLRRMKFHKPIRWFKNGMEGIEFLKSKPQDDSIHSKSIILLDIDMPVMDGWEFLREFEKLNPTITSKYKIIVRTSSHDPNDSLKAMRIGSISEFMNKPVTTEQLMAVFRKLVLI
ncbi:response regulator [Algoriphagus sp. AGSA1]|uniref:response regulator n=1 Tax=Algoriphagus sp. AGSA1 TaxID=2907213 RepID=UPI001F30E294|nr:response regulator [Algoriphagus sp. AGSA1]MCE7053724.1 response regulator [Algoriphagus sp. AGSA1]